MGYFRLFAILILACLGLTSQSAYSQAVPTGDQLDQLVAPIALYPDTLLAQICAATTDPQQILDTDAWVKQNASLKGQALVDAAQKKGFDAAFISLVNFPSVLDMMAAHIDDYAALGTAFKADQTKVMASVQKLRQAAYANGALDSNEYQKVSTTTQGSTQVIVVQPANPQVVYVPQYQPQQVYAAPPAQASGPSTGDVVAASLLSFGLGIGIGALIAHNNEPWGWGGWGWGWGGRGVYVHNSVYVVNNRYRAPRPYYRPRPPVYGRPIYARPPTNWYARPGYRPPPAGYRPYGPNSPAYRAGYRPPPTPYRAPEGAAYRPPASGYRPPANTYRPPAYNATRPAGGVGATAPATRPGAPAGNVGATRPSGNVGAPRPAGSSYNGRTNNAGSAPRPEDTGRRPGGFNGSNNGAAERQASQRGRASAGGHARFGGRNK
jgi:hypothetical protein